MFDSLKWKIIGLALAAFGSTAAGGIAVENLFDREWFAQLLEDPTSVGATGGSVILLPILFFLLSGIRSYFVSVAVLTVAMTAGLIYLQGAQLTEVEWGPLLTLTGVGSAAAVLLYRIVT